MNRFLVHIIHIALLIIVLGFANCNNQDFPDDIRNFQKNHHNDIAFIEKLARSADSCTSKHSKNYAFFEKKSEIFFQKGLNNLRKNDLKTASDDLFNALDSEKNSIRLKGNATNDDLHYLGQIFESIGDIYNNVNSVKPASYFYDEALSQFEKASRHHEVIDMLLKIGDLYQKNHISNIALLNYETAEAKKNLTETQLNEILIKKGIALYDISDVETADSIHELISQKSLQSIEYNYFTSLHFYNRNEFEKSLPDLLYCFKYGSPSMKISTAELLADIYFRMGNRYEELQYAQYQAKVTSAEARLTPMKMEIEAAYDQYIEDVSGKNINRTGRLNMTGWILLIASIISLIGVASAYFISKNKNKKSHQVIRDIEKIIDDKEKIIDDKEKIINDISKKLEDASNNIPARSFDEDYKVFSETNIFKEIKSSLEGKTIMTKTVGDYPRLALSNVKLITLTKKFNECFPNLVHTLIEVHPALTTNDIRYIILGTMGFSCQEIAVLLQLTYSTANKRNKHIRSVLGTEEALEHYLPDYLRSLKY